MINTKRDFTIEELERMHTENEAEMERLETEDITLNKRVRELHSKITKLHDECSKIYGALSSNEEMRNYLFDANCEITKRLEEKKSEVTAKKETPARETENEKSKIKTSSKSKEASESKEKINSFYQDIENFIDAFCEIFYD